MSDRPKSLAGFLWLRSGGHDFSLPLAGVRRVALSNQLRVAPPERGAPSWWCGVTLDDGRSHPLLNLADLMGAPASRGIGPDTVVVLASLWQLSVGLVCDRFRGIIPAGDPSWPLSPALFSTSERALPRMRLWAGRPMLDLAPEQLFSAQQRAQFDQAMKNSKVNVDQLWELSELEQQLAVEPTVTGYNDLAARYKKLGWLEEAERMQARAAQLKTEAPAMRVTAGGLSGPVNHRVLLELLQVLHLTGKSGELLLDAPGGITGAISFRVGAMVDAKSADAEDALKALRQLCAIKAGRYQFFPGVPSQTGESRLPADTTTLIAELEKQVISAP